ncbi:MAG: TonB-dependent receptor [Steroidobacteraceae bacterium]|jgi:iron complex outermembrane receptor protein|nr:TonB-dependent receptor [Steroidobacteraceae bacterium]
MYLSRSLSRAVATVLAIAAAPVAAYAAGADRGDGLQEIVVTAAPLSRSPLEIAQPTTVLAGVDLRRSLGASLGETLSEQLGVTGTWFGPNSSRPVIRGLGGERVLMLEDGIESLDASALSQDHAVTIEGLAADQIEILKGPATLLYGNGAAGGLVNVLTNRIHSVLPDDPTGAIEVRADTALGEQTAAGRVDFAVGRLAVHADAYTRTTDDVEIPGFAMSAAERAEELAEGEELDDEPGKIENSAGRADGGGFGVSYVGDRGFLGLSYTRFETRYGLPGKKKHEHGDDHDDEADAPPIAAAEGDEEAEAGPKIDLRQNRYDLAGELAGGEGWFRRLRVRSTFSDYTHAELEGDGAIGTLFEQDGWETRVAVDHAFGAFRGTAGVQFRDQDFVASGEEAFVPPSRTRNAGVFVFQERPVETGAGRVTLEFGGRLERQTVDPEAGLGLPDYDETSYTLSAGAVWRFRPTAAFAANLTRAERHPTSTELYAEGPHAAVRRYEIGDPTLEKETSTSLDLALRSTGEARVRWQVNAYLNDFADFVYLQPTGAVEDDFDVYEFRQDDARTWGVEAEVEFPLLSTARGDLGARLAGDYVRGELADGGPLPQLPPLRVGAELAWKTPRFEAGASVYRYAEQDRVAEFERPTDGYTLLGLDVSWRVASAGGQALLFARASNLLDEEARRHTSPLKEFAPLPGRSFTAGVRFDF